MVLWSAITSSLVPGHWKQESDAGDIPSQTFVNQEFARALTTREKKQGMYYAGIYWVSIYICYARENTSWKISWGMLMLQKSLEVRGDVIKSFLVVECNCKKTKTCNKLK